MSSPIFNYSSYSHIYENKRLYKYEQGPPFWNLKFTVQRINIIDIQYYINFHIPYDLNLESFLPPWNYSIWLNDYRKKFNN